MLRNDEIVALNALMFAERWRLHPWLDIRWNPESETYSTFILHSAYETVEDEAECEIRSLDDLNVVLATDAEFYRNVTTLISIGALEAYDVEVEFLVQVIVDRITGKEAKTPYGYSMLAGKFSTASDHIYQFDEREAETGRLALEAIKVLSRTGDWWGETLEIRHVDKEWSYRTSEYIPSDNKYFSVKVVAKNAYRFRCRESVNLTEENFDLFVESVDDVIFNGGAVSAGQNGVTQTFWASCLFCERSDEVKNELSPSVLRKMPLQISSLFHCYGTQAS
jgi:hypothetical protein